ncbi:MAG: MerC domain-containing protein [Ferruginibacter sp.]
MNTKINWDRWGMITSLACAIHCALLPLIFTSLPLFGADIIHNVFFEWTMIGLAFCIGIYSLGHGYLKHRVSPLPVLLFTAGFILLVSKEIFGKYEVALLVPAVALIITAHYLNYRFCHKAQCASPHHKH